MHSETEETKDIYSSRWEENSSMEAIQRDEEGKDRKQR